VDSTRSQIQFKVSPSLAAQSGVLQRACGCGNHTLASSECDACSKKKGATQPQRSRIQAERVNAVPPIVHEVLRSSGQPLDASTRAFMEPRFGHDFSNVRVHADGRAAESAKAVSALAYTVGPHVVFGTGEYGPDTDRGRQLVAHELVHVVQQRGASIPASEDKLTVDLPHSALEVEAHGISKALLGGEPDTGAISSARRRSRTTTQTLSRANPDATGYAMRLGLSQRTGLQFVPTNVTDIQVGPVTAQGGLLSAGASRLNVIIGENLTPRRLARQLLPLWITATPFTPPGAAAPLPLVIISEDELAMALLVYNQTYLPVPAMTNWRSGLRLPLPVEIDPGTGIATLHPLQIRALAGAFQPAWAPQLDLRAAAPGAPPPATLQADVTRFLARETTSLARGIHLGARALTNAVAELPFIRECFRQLGASSFDVALQFMDNLVNNEISQLAAQRDGASILAEVRTALATAPAVPTAAQQASLTRANLMIGLVAATPAQAPPSSARTRAEKTITVDTLKLDGSTHDPATDVAMAYAILSQCNVRVNHGVAATATNAQTIGWIGDTDLRSAGNCAAPSAEERALFQTASTAVGLNARFRAFFPATVSGVRASGYSCRAGLAPHPLFRNSVIVANSGDTATLSHELGHILINLGPHPAVGLMSARPARPAMRLPQLSDANCTAMYNNA
jgi:Domain of unknown function (DUF4157)